MATKAVIGPEKFIRWLDQDKDGMPLIVWDYVMNRGGRPGKTALDYSDERLLTSEGLAGFWDIYKALYRKRYKNKPPGTGKWDIFKHFFLESDKNRIEAWRN